MAFGLSVVAMAYSTGPIAGAHLDPAVSLGFFVSGRMKTDDLVGYVVSQCGRDCRIGGYVSKKVSGAAVEARSFLRPLPEGRRATNFPSIRGADAADFLCRKTGLDPMHVAQKIRRLLENDMHENKDLERRLNPF